MAKDLHDVRSKVSTRALSLIHAMEFFTGQTMSEVLRPVIEEWADKEIHKASLVMSVMQTKGGAGQSGAGFGAGGSDGR